MLKGLAHSPPRGCPTACCGEEARGDRAEALAKAGVALRRSSAQLCHWCPAACCGELHFGPPVLLREQECHREAEAPIRATMGLLGVIAPSERETDRLFADLQQLADGKVDGHYPILTLPVVGGLGV